MCKTSSVLFPYAGILLLFAIHCYIDFCLDILCYVVWANFFPEISKFFHTFKYLYFSAVIVNQIINSHSCISRTDWVYETFHNFNCLWQYNLDLSLYHCFTLLCYDCTWEVSRSSVHCLLMTENGRCGTEIQSGRKD